MLGRAKIFSQFIAIELVIQALGWVSGLLLIRTLDQTQYAYFTIANTMQSTMNQLADTGISISLSAIGGKVWQDRYRFGQLINTAMQLRYYLASISITAITPILLWMLIHNGASLAYAIVITIAVLVGLNFQLTTGVLEVIPRLHSQINRIQNLSLWSIVSRLALLGLAYLTVLNASVAVTTMSIIQGLQRVILGRWAGEKIEQDASTNKEDRKFILQTLRIIAPSSIFFCFQGQLTILLISIFGNTQNIAEIGALGRLGVIFTIINSVMATIILPSFARCQILSLLRLRYFQVLGFFSIFSLVLIILTANFTQEILWILGSKYSHLQNELLLMMISTVISSLVNFMASMNLAKAWIKYSWVEIPLRLFLQSILLLNLNVSTVHGAILFGLFSNISPFLFNAFLTSQGMKDYNMQSS